MALSWKIFDRGVDAIAQGFVGVTEDEDWVDDRGGVFFMLEGLGNIGLIISLFNIGGVLGVLKDFANGAVNGDGGDFKIERLMLLPLSSIIL